MSGLRKTLYCIYSVAKNAIMVSIVDEKLLLVFLSVADTLNFSRSSEQLHTSLSAVSRSIQRLESDLGQTLLERDNRRVRLTKQGSEFRVYAQKALNDWQFIKRKMNEETELAGEVSLFCSVTASYSILAPILESFRVLHPSVEIMMHTGDQADAIARILSGQDDLAVTGHPQTLSPRLDFLPLLESPIVFCAPAADCVVRQLLLATDPRSDDFDWSLVPFIVPERGVSKMMLDEWFSHHNIVPNIYAQVAGHEAIVAMVGLGLGVGIAPELVIGASGMSDKVTQLPVRHPLPALNIGLCGLRSRLESPLVKSLWNAARDQRKISV